MTGIIYTQSDVLRIQKDNYMSFHMKMKGNNLPTYLRLTLSYGSIKCLPLSSLGTRAIIKYFCPQKYVPVQEGNYLGMKQ